MSTALQQAPSDNQLSVTQQTYAQVVQKPFRVLPSEIRDIALMVWMCHRHLAGFDSALSLCTSIGVWVSQFGLHAEDAVRILQEMVHPESMQSHKFASDLISHLAAKAASAIKFRKAQEENERRERESKEAADNPPTPEQKDRLKNMLSECFATL